MVKKTDSERNVSMNAVWILIAIGIVGGALAKPIAWLCRRDGQADLGFVSQQWLAEHRLR